MTTPASEQSGPVGDALADLIASYTGELIAAGQWDYNSYAREVIEEAKAERAKLVEERNALTDEVRRFVTWFEGVKDYQEPQLMRGLEKAEQNWDTATRIEPFDTSRMKALLQQTTGKGRV